MLPIESLALHIGKYFSRITIDFWGFHRSNLIFTLLIQFHMLIGLVLLAFIHKSPFNLIIFDVIYRLVILLAAIMFSWSVILVFICDPHFLPQFPLLVWEVYNVVFDLFVFRVLLVPKNLFFRFILLSIIVQALTAAFLWFITAWSSIFRFLLDFHWVVYWILSW